jgi:hypothetical protein
MAIPQGHEWGHPIATTAARSPGPSTAATTTNTNTSSGDTSPLPLRRGAVFFRGDTSEGLDCSRGCRGQLEALHKRLTKDNKDSREVDADGTPLRDRFDFQKGEMGQSYYAFCPSRMACWSMRLYDALLHDVVPVLLADAVVEPFERCAIIAPPLLLFCSSAL